MAEFERVPEEAIRAFSRRRQSLVEHMEAMGTDGFAASRMAALATREQKEQVDLPRLREEWKARAAEHGLGRRELKRLGRERSREPVLAIDRDELAARLFGPDDGLTAKQTACSRRQKRSPAIPCWSRSSRTKLPAGRHGSPPASCSRWNAERSGSRSAAARRTRRAPTRQSLHVC